MDMQTYFDILLIVVLLELMLSIKSSVSYHLPERPTSQLTDMQEQLRRKLLQDLGLKKQPDASQVCLHLISNGLSKILELFCDDSDI